MIQAWRACALVSILRALPVTEGQSIFATLRVAAGCWFKPSHVARALTSTNDS